MNGTLSNRPLLSVVIATYNRANDLDRAIKSVLAEPGEFFEVIVGDDGSPDHTPEVVSRHRGDPRLRDYRNPTNLGMRDNYLKIFREARGDYLFILTDDDYLLPGALAKVAQIAGDHPEVGYMLSDLPTVDERTGAVVNLHRTYSRTIIVQPSLAAMAHISRSAWVLSRQVIRRDQVDWVTWEKFKSNIFFPIIFAGRALLQAPCYYLAEPLVRHTWFNKVYWSAFGRNELDIQFNLALDSFKCMRAILHDHAPTPESVAVIDRWEANAFKSYLYLPHLGFYDLVKTLGVRAALQKLRGTYTLNSAQRLELLLFPVKIPFARAWANLKAAGRRLPAPIVASLKSFRNRFVPNA